MSEHCGYIVKVEKLRPHTNADRLQIATFFGNDTCVGLDVNQGDIGIYFPADLQLSTEYCEVNNLVRKKDENGNSIGGYMDPDKRNVTSIRLRGEKSDGIFADIKSLEYTGANLAEFRVGDPITEVNGHEICCKYIPRTNKRRGNPSTGGKVRKHKEPIAPLFAEHADTEQLAYNMGAFLPGDLVEITLKMHGTSQRTGYLPKFSGYKDSKFQKGMNKIKAFLNTHIKTSFAEKHGAPIYDWGYVTGTRRTVLQSYDGGFYGSDKFREPHAKMFEGRLHKGETVYYEVVGFTDTGVPIMGEGHNEKLHDKGFVKQYGKITTFSYGCAPDGKKRVALANTVDKNGTLYALQDCPTSDFYVYRMTMTNEDGDVVEYTPDFMRYRCEQMGVKTVPVFWRGFLNEPDDWTGDQPWDAGEYVKSIAEQFYDGPDPIGKTHVREGVVCRILNRPKFCAYKHKNFAFKCLSGIAIAEAEQNGELIDNADILSEM